MAPPGLFLESHCPSSWMRRVLLKQGVLRPSVKEVGRSGNLPTVRVSIVGTRDRRPSAKQVGRSAILPTARDDFILDESVFSSIASSTIVRFASRSGCRWAVSSGRQQRHPHVDRGLLTGDRLPRVSQSILLGQSARQCRHRSISRRTESCVAERPVAKTPPAERLAVIRRGYRACRAAGPGGLSERVRLGRADAARTSVSKSETLLAAHHSGD